MTSAPCQIDVTPFARGEAPNMFNVHQTSDSERRESDREPTTDVWMSCFLELGDGTVIEGVVKNFSQGGAKIVATSAAVDVGDEARVVIVLLGDQKVQCRCEVRHVDRETNTLGLRFLSRPEPVEEVRSKRCGRCRKQFSASSNYCPRCGRRLDA